MWQLDYVHNFSIMILINNCHLALRHGNARSLTFWVLLSILLTFKVQVESRYFLPDFRLFCYPFIYSQPILFHYFSILRTFSCFLMKIHFHTWRWHTLSQVSARNVFVFNGRNKCQHNYEIQANKVQNLPFLENDENTLTNFLHSKNDVF